HRRVLFERIRACPRSVLFPYTTLFRSRSASDLVHGLRVIKAMGGETWAVDRYRQTSDAAAVAGIATGERTGRLAGLGALVMSTRSEEHTSELQSRFELVCRLLL